MSTPPFVRTAASLPVEAKRRSKYREKGVIKTLLGTSSGNSKFIKNENKTEV